MDITTEVAVSAFTDLIAAVILLPLILVLARRRTDKPAEKRLWLIFFILLCISCVMGFIAHYVCRDPVSFKWIWVPLYALLFGTADAFGTLAVYILRAGDRPGRRTTLVLHLLTAAAYLTTVLIWVIAGIAEVIRIFAAFAAVVGIASFVIMGIVAASRRDRGTAVSLLTLVPLFPAVWLQLDRTVVWHLIWTVDYNGLTHLLVIVSILILFTTALIRLSRNNDTAPPAE